MPKKLVFIHGRAQQNKNAGDLKDEWISAFRQGLRKTGLDLPIPQSDIRFPYFGDTLEQLSDGADVNAVAAVIIRGTASQAEQNYIRGVLKEVSLKYQITEDDVEALIPLEVKERGILNWEWVQALLRVLDRRIPFGSAASVALFTKDVYDYLTKGGVRDTIDAGVEKAISPSEPTVVVSHSLGTVVAYNVLRRTGLASGWKIPLFVTLGSPLGVKQIRQSIAPTSFPLCVEAWFNARDEHDVVALHPLVRPHFIVDHDIANKDDVLNHTSNRHGIAGYLDDAEVAKTIYDALL